MMIVYWMQLAQISSGVERVWWRSASGIPFSLAVALLVVLALLLIVCYRRTTRATPRRWWMAVLRIAAIGLTVLALADVTQQKAMVELPRIVVAIDSSQSSGFADRYPNSDWLSRRQAQATAQGLDAITRLSLAQLPWLESDGALWRKLNRKYRVELFEIGSDAKRIECDENNVVDKVRSVTATDERSEIGTAVSQLLQSQVAGRCVAFVLMTDGAVTSGISLSAAAAEARESGIPLYVVGLGSEHRPPDVELTDLRSSDRLLVGDSLELSVDVGSFGLAGQSGRVDVVLLPASQLLASQEFEIDSNAFQRQLSFDLAMDIPGSLEIGVRCEALAGEISTRNNSLSKRVEVVQREIRVLIVSQTPHPEFRFLHQALTRAVNPRDGSRSFLINALVFEASADYPQIDETALDRFPTDPSVLNDYDVIIISDVQLAGPGKRGLSDIDLRRIAKYVETEQGGLIMIAGPRSLPADYAGTPISPLFPFDLSLDGRLLSNGSYVAELSPTSLGNRLGPTAAIADYVENTTDRARLPIRWAFRSDVLKPTALVMCELKNAVATLPAISLQPVDSGLVVFHWTDELYRIRYHNSGKWYSRYWSELVRFLAQSRIQRHGRTGRLTTSRGQYREGDVVEFRAEIFDQQMVAASERQLGVIIENEQGVINRLELARSGETLIDRAPFVGQLANLKSGRYIASLDLGPVGQPVETQFAIEPRRQEMIDLQLQAETLQAAAETSGGRYFQVQEMDQLWDQLPQPGWTTIQQLPSEPVWTSPAVRHAFAFLLIALLAGEWLIRFRAKLP